MILFVVKEDNRHTIQWYLDSHGRSLRDVAQVFCYRSLLRRRRVPVGTYVFSDIERLSPAELELAGAFCREIAAVPGMRILNDPLRVRRRYELLRVLHADGLNGFNVYRAADAIPPMRYPVFLRAEEHHQGPITPLLDSEQALREAIDRLADQGIARDDKLIVEFEEVSDDRGLYHKYGAIRVGPAIVPLELDFSRSWVVKEMEHILDDSGLAAEETDYVRQNPHRAEIETVFDVARIDFGRIDYAVKDGRLVTFEINTAPSLVTAVDGHGAVFAESFGLAMRGLAEAIRAIDTPAPAGRWARIDTPTLPPYRTTSLLWQARLIVHRLLCTVGLLSVEPAIIARLTRLRDRLRGRRTRTTS